MLWLKALHFISLLVWCATLLYLPGLFLLHRHAQTRSQYHRARVMTRFTFAMLASPAAVIAIISGTGLVFARMVQGEWLIWKLLLVALMVCFHLYCGSQVVRLGHRIGLVSPARLTAQIAVPVMLMSAVFWLALAKPAGIFSPA
ncbi:MAG: CopD family protein [Pigmentiphaga sp.]|uniref:CopD family protein n=1 Tax=Pigmentiphaga sp. TaxID=1977564 RepID=UPI0029B9FC45|nr:CopD family protein [Pigmentiphaga sp.]MDX3904206.1 CopD family protein [Pigmentiphaga sp.]